MTEATQQQQQTSLNGQNTCRYFVSHVNVHQRVTSGKEDFNYQVNTNQLLSTAISSIATVLMIKLAIAAEIDVMHRLSWCKDGGDHKARNVGGFWKLGMTSGHQPAQKQRPDFYDHLEMNSASNLNEPGNGFSPEPPEKEAQLC